MTRLGLLDIASLMDSLRQTPIYQAQADLGARFVPFVGWSMPVQFEGLIAEHQAVRTAAGLFDVSHMGEVRICGPEAGAYVQYLVTNDIGKLVPGKALYTVMCQEDGGIVDDLIVYQEATDRFFLCINAGRSDEDLAHIRNLASRFRCVVEDISEDYAQLALQGPKAEAILSQLTQVSLEDMAPFSWQDTEVAGVPEVRIARTGYTGEPGYELYIPAAQGAKVYGALLEAGQPHGLKPCGLGARDTLRLEMKYPLYGNDIDVRTHPLEAGLGWLVKLKAGDFFGREALVAAREKGLTRKWVGLEICGRGIPRAGFVIGHEGEAVGSVTSGTHSPSLGRAIAAGYVPLALSKVGTPLQVEIRGKWVDAKVCATPFYRRETP